jgi:hypothetical protein
MTQIPAPSGSPSLIELLTVGNVVTAGLQLYRFRLKTYLGIAAIAVLWILLPFLVLIPIVIILINNSGNTPALWLLIPVWLLMLFYGLARSLSEIALISRLAFGELINQPETVRIARRHTQSRMWGFLFVTFLVAIILTGIAIGLYIVLSIASVVIFLPLGLFGQTLGTSPLTIVVGVVLGIAFLLLLATAMSWFFARFAIAEVPLAIETGIGASTSVGRSWNLTQGNAMRTLLILWVASLITIPIQAFIQICITLIQVVLGQIIAQGSPIFISLYALILYGLVLLSSILLIPFWQSVKAVIYYDLRSRREGLGLRLRDRNLTDRDNVDRL